MGLKTGKLARRGNEKNIDEENEPNNVGQIEKGIVEHHDE